MKHPSRKCVVRSVGGGGALFGREGNESRGEGHRLPAVVVVDAEEGAGEGHYFSVSDEYAGVDLSWWGGDEGCPKQGDTEEAE